MRAYPSWSGVTKSPGRTVGGPQGHVLAGAKPLQQLARHGLTVLQQLRVCPLALQPGGWAAQHFEGHVIGRFGSGLTQQLTERDFNVDKGPRREHVGFLGVRRRGVNRHMARP